MWNPGGDHGTEQDVREELKRIRTDEPAYLGGTQQDGFLRCDKCPTGLRGVDNRELAAGNVGTV